MGKRLLPHLVLVPSVQQAAHIGIEGGLHAKGLREDIKRKIRSVNLKPFHPVKSVLKYPKLIPHQKGYGGWGHPADHNHCLELFNNVDAVKRDWKHVLGII
jgi:hypothetical protein